LPEDGIDAFKDYVQWLYTGKIHLEGNSKSPGYYTKLAKVYVLGEKLMNRRFQDDVIDALVAASRDSKRKQTARVTARIRLGLR